MLDNYGFDLWADNYDKSVEAADNSDDYPFAGYRHIMNAIYGTVMQKGTCKVLDVGIGTGVLAKRLYDSGNDITAIDFSEKMLSIAAEKMPKAKLYKFDFTKGLPAEVASAKFDFIISAYALHHLADDEKIAFIRIILDCLNDGGAILIGDVCFRDRAALERCQELCGDEWDDDEHYIVFSELYKAFESVCIMEYHQFSHCGGVMEIRLH